MQEQVSSEEVDACKTIDFCKCNEEIIAQEEFGIGPGISENDASVQDPDETGKSVEEDSRLKPLTNQTGIEDGSVTNSTNVVNSAGGILSPIDGPSESAEIENSDQKEITSSDGSVNATAD